MARAKSASGGSFLRKQESGKERSVKVGFHDAVVSYGRPCYPCIPRFAFSRQDAQNPWVFQISVVQGIGEIDDAPWVTAVPEPVGMAQLVDRFLDGPLQKEGDLGWLDRYDCR